MPVLRLFSIWILFVCACAGEPGGDEVIAEHSAELRSPGQVPLRYCYYAKVRMPSSPGVVHGRGLSYCDRSPRTAYEQGRAALGSMCAAARNRPQCLDDGSLAIYPDVRGDGGDTPDVIARYGYQATYARVSEGARQVMAFFEGDTDARAVDYRSSLRKLDELLAMLARWGREHAQMLVQPRQRVRRLPARLAELGAAHHGPERARLAQERSILDQARDVMDEHSGRVEHARVAIDSLLVSFRHYQASEDAAKDKLSKLVRRGSAAGLSQLAGLHTEWLRLGRVEMETSGQLLYRAQASKDGLAQAEQHVTTWIGPHRQFLEREGIPVPELTSTLIATLDEIIGYCEARRQWMRAHLEAAKDGLARREQALEIVGADPATRERLIAEARARSEVVLAREAGLSSGDVWQAQPHAGGVELVQARYQGAVRLVQMAALCGATPRLPWMQAGCEMYQDQGARAQAYLAHELPAVLAADAQVLRAAGDSETAYMPDMVAALERDLQHGNLASAVLVHDAIARALEQQIANHEAGAAEPAVVASAEAARPAETTRREAAARRAQRMATIEWEVFRFADSCQNAELVRQGQANFEVNGVPIPTYTRRIIRYSHGGAKGLHYGSLHPSLFRVGKNRFYFTVHNSTGTPECNHLRHIVELVGASREPIRLFEVMAVGRDYTGETEIELSLQDIDPRLARSIQELRAKVETRLRELDELGPRSDAVTRELAQLEQLLADIDALLERGFDQISVEELEALLSPYAQQFPRLAAQVRQVLEDMTRVIGELRAELARIAGELRGWADGLADSLLGNAGTLTAAETRFSGPELPAVEIPEIPEIPGEGGEGEGEEPNPYDDYAEAVIARLFATLDTSGDKVLLRPEFLGVVAAWRSNLRALEAALAARGVVGQAEYGKFLRAQEKVTAVLARFVGEDGWFRDSPVDTDIRQLVDTAVLHPERAQRLKASLMVMTELSGPEAAVIFGLVFTLRELDGAIRAAPANAEQRARLEAKQHTLWESAISFAGAAATVGWDIAVTLTPAGDLIDICEAISGKAGCHLAGGRELSWRERAFAGVGLVMWGSTAAIRKLGRKADALACAAQLASARLACSAEQFFAKLADAIARVPKRRPKKDVAAVIPLDGGSMTYVTRTGSSV